MIISRRCSTASRLIGLTVVSRLPSGTLVRRAEVLRRWLRAERLLCGSSGQWSNIPFLKIKESDIKLSVQVNIVAATAFSQQAVAAFIADA